MTLRFHLAVAALAATFAFGCGADRTPWVASSAGDVPEDRAGGELPGDAGGAPVDLLPELVDAAPELVDGVDTAPELVDTAPELGPEVVDATDAVDHVDGADGEICTPDCAAKACGADGCGGSCGACPDSKPFCNMAFQCEACEADCGEKICGSDGCGGSCGLCPAGWPCVLGTCAPPPCQGDQLLYAEDFTQCNEGALGVVDDQPDDPVLWMVMEEGALSPPCALHFGDPVGGTYDTGDPVSAALELPPVTIPDDGDPYAISFAVRLDLEPVVAPEYPYDHDAFILRAYGVGLPGAGVVLFTSKELLNNTGGAWVPVAATLSEYAGLTLDLRFEFDTIDSVDNGYQGIWLDDLRVGTACPLCFQDGDCVDDEPCLADLCVLFSNQGTFGACSHPFKLDCCVGLEASFCEDLDPCTEDACDPVTGDCTHTIIEGCIP